MKSTDEDYKSLAYDGAPLLRVPLCVSRAFLVFVHDTALTLKQYTKLAKISKDLSYAAHCVRGAPTPILRQLYPSRQADRPSLADSRAHIDES